MSCRILERIGARALSAHLRKFCDYLVFEFANSGGGQQVNKCVDAINDMIWKYNIVTIDRLVLCLVSLFYLLIFCDCLSAWCANENRLHTIVITKIIYSRHATARFSFYNF